MKCKLTNKITFEELLCHKIFFQGHEYYVSMDKVTNYVYIPKSGVIKQDIVKCDTEEYKSFVRIFGNKNHRYVICSNNKSIGLDINDYLIDQKYFMTKGRYRIIDIKYARDRIKELKELKEAIYTNTMSGQRKMNRLNGMIKIYEEMLTMGTDVIPEIEKAFDAGRERIKHPDWDYIYEDFDTYINQLKLDI